METESHQDVFKLRFDHLAFGGTSILFIAAAIRSLLALSDVATDERGGKDKTKRRAIAGSQQLLPPPQTPQSFQMQPMMPSIPPMPIPMPWYPMMPYQPTNQQLGASHHSPRNPSRFKEIPEPMTDSLQPPGRPPPPRSRELPPPRTATTEPACRSLLLHNLIILILLLNVVPFRDHPVTAADGPASALRSPQTLTDTPTSLRHSR